MNANIHDFSRVLGTTLLLFGFCAGLAAQSEGTEPVKQAPAQLEPAKFFVVRHADRDGKNDALTEAGRRRAAALRDFMLEQHVRAVYSTNTARTRGTATPTARDAELEIALYAGRLPSKQWFADLKNKHAGQSVLVVGHSNTVVPFVRALGGRTKYRFAEDDYHPMFIVSVRDGEAQTVRINYGAMAARGVPEPDPKRTEKARKEAARKTAARDRVPAVRKSAALPQQGR